MSTRLSKKAKAVFESIKRTDENGNEWWSSRELAKALTYTDYRNFLEVMRKAWDSCKNSGQNPNHHFVKVTEMIPIGKTAEREVETWLMSRYVCYLAVQNADPSKTIVAQAQTYFAIQTRRAEKLLDTPFSEEEEHRLMLRSEMKKHNTRLASAAKESGVLTNKDYGIFQNAGYKGLYGGLDQDDIHKRKKLKENQRILDHMGSTELAANLFRATQTEDKLRRDKIQGKAAANRTHFEVGQKVRDTIMELGGTMPENLPTPESIKRLESKQKRLIDKRKSTEDSE
ncbi:DNA damage-inducible protein D [Muribaculaceae bacterium Isolate-002 (NCI)]|nr:DNA damage-inducible protein D [Muribaculaceae bacterium Isolate-002 (NCI)]